MKVTVLGSGSWGTAIAILLAQNGHDVILWSADSAKSRHLEASHRHPNLPGAVLPEALRFTPDLLTACRHGEVTVFAVASRYIRSTAARAASCLPEGACVVTAAKGIEKETLLTMSEILEDELKSLHVRVAAVSGPTHAEEVALGMPTALVCASRDEALCDLVCRLFSSPVMRTYPAKDIRGVEICGALKNIVALAAGIAAGLGYGDNALAAIITRGMTEIRRLGLSLGCERETFESLAGIGDLIVTCFSEHSRNRMAGLYIGQGMSPADAISKVGMVVEGVYALEAAVRLYSEGNVYMPITRSVYDIIYGGVKAETAAQKLMTNGRGLFDRQQKI